MIVTIDGPAGAGKSSIAKGVADALGFDFLDTGAMYRALTLGAIRTQIDWDDVDALAEYARIAVLKWENNRIFLDDLDVSDDIRSPTVTSAIHYFADLPRVRSELSSQQRRIAIDRDMVTEGRDQGSEVFPDAQCKIFLTASPEERARRRQEQLTQAGRFLPLDEILSAQNRRDHEDESRPLGALKPAQDAVIIHSDGMTSDEVMQRVLAVIKTSAKTSATAAKSGNSPLDR